MKKAVGHLVPFMEKEREKALAASGEKGSENVTLRYIALYTLKTSIFLAGSICGNSGVSDRERRRA